MLQDISSKGGIKLNRATNCFHPFEDQNLSWLLELQSQNRAEHPFIIFEPFDAPQIVLTYSQFFNQARRLASGMQQRGIKRGDPIIIHLDNSAEILHYSARSP